MSERKETYVYYYDGPVMKFDDCVCNRWYGETFAVSESKARTNLAYRYKRQNGLSPSCKITLPGKIYLEQ